MTRAANVAALEALECGDLGLAVQILLDALEADGERVARWPGQILPPVDLEERAS